MCENFISTNGKLSKLDKFIIVYNFEGLNEVFNQGFCYAKSKIKKSRDIAGIWKITAKK